MSRFRRIEIFEPSPSLYIKETSFFIPPTLTFPLDLFPHCFPPNAPSSCEIFDSLTDLIQIEKTPLSTSYKKLQARTTPDSYLQTLADRVSALELTLDRFVNENTCNLDRKYSWTAEVKRADKDGGDRRYTWTAEIKGAKKGAKLGDFTDSDSDFEKKKKKKKKESKAESSTSTRVVEIEEPVDQRAIVLRQAFAKRDRANVKGKKKELSPEDAALIIQMSFRAYLIRRSKALRALRELAVAKIKLKEIRASFNNFSYRCRIARDGEERQRFSEKIIVLLLTVDAIEGADVMVRAARRSMLDELEAMLDAVDPQPSQKLGSMKRRKFDLPEGCINKEIAAGVAKVVQMLNED